MNESGGKILRRPRHVPYVRNASLRLGLSLVLLVISAAVASGWSGRGGIQAVALVLFPAWLVSMFLTEKHIHKYPQRYLTYLFASHGKAAFIMAVLAWAACVVAGTAAPPPGTLWPALLIFIALDLSVSLPHRREDPPAVAGSLPGSPAAAGETAAAPTSEPLPDRPPILRHLPSGLDASLVRFMEEHLGTLRGAAEELLVLECASEDSAPAAGPARLLVCQTRFNDVRRLNRFLLQCAGRIGLGGYLAGSYLPLENDPRMRVARGAGALSRAVYLMRFVWLRAFPKIPVVNKLYFAVTNGRNRVFSKAEIWGRLSYCGMSVVAESPGDGERHVIARRVSAPVDNRKPTYYPIVSLEKVGLDGGLFHTHKIRTMFPFSEFLQKRIFEDHGLSSTGKFKNDFRLTEYGPFLRKYWLDELPGIFDWVRGDIKLVGLRATSRHYLGLYPKRLNDLYIQIKPGLVPPIFDESTSGFDQIAQAELSYLERYWDKPLRTDVRYLWQTFRDIVFVGIRSH